MKAALLRPLSLLVDDYEDESEFLRPQSTQPLPRWPAAEDTSAVDFPLIVFIHEGEDAGDDVAIREEEISWDNGLGALEPHGAELDAAVAAQAGVLRAHEIGKGLDIAALLEADRDLPVGAGVVVLPKGGDLFPDHGVEFIGRGGGAAALDPALQKNSGDTDREETDEEDDFGNAFHGASAASAASRRR